MNFFLTNSFRQPPVAARTGPRYTAMFAMGAALLASAQVGLGQAATSPVDPARYGPYNAIALPAGPGLRMPLQDAHDPLLEPSSPWTISCWVKADDPVSGLELVAGMGDITGEYPRYLALEPGQATLWMGGENKLSARFAVPKGSWHLLTATFDGTSFSLFGDGRMLTHGNLTRGTATAVLQIAPPVLAPAQAAHFGGRVAAFVVQRRALSAAEVAGMVETPPAYDLLSWDLDAKPWPVQTRGQAGYDAPQDPGQLPVSKAPYSKPAAIRREPMGESLTPSEAGQWTFSDGWTMQEAPAVTSSGEQIATADFAAGNWMRATVPGTVLTTLIDDGVYPDPYYGLNNLAIPETLNKQDYWYRNVFTVPAPVSSALESGHVELTFEGINYAAQIWLNGIELGAIKGAFRRGTFDVTKALHAGGGNVLAVKIAPPPHPGIPQEQSVLGGPGENGGAMELDGPTFLATEGWDWLPAIRDRDSGLWQPVTLTVSGQVKLGDAQVVTTFANHDYAHAAVLITVPVQNLSGKPLQTTVEAHIETLALHKTVTLPPGASEVKLTPEEFPALGMEHPRLWWPNGYGRPELYTLKLALSSEGHLSDQRQIRFGVREVSYELSLLDATGHLQRVEYTPANGALHDAAVVDVSHAGMREIASADGAALKIAEDKRTNYHYRSVVSSLAPGAEHSAAIRQSADLGTAPYLVIVVNGVRIAARGGNWGMDDARKRVSRERLEPYFRLDRDANMNIIRNWVGQSTEETFYELADEYGMMVWNDFWESTQNYNLEAEDPQLFLANAEDTIKHFRNHPSIVLWCGRNEGVPQPILNQGLDALTRQLDGTRFYSPSSNQINLQQSGPYSYQDPSLYYTTLNRGFSVETGTPSMSTLESFQSSTPQADQWPMDDVWAYHDWHAEGNGKVQPFMQELEAEFGAPENLADFERKAQMLNYVDHRAIFEGMNANLWAPNSGRMLWMTQPAWPSTMWQILSSDYDTQASFYGTKKAAEPLHIQLNLATHQVDVVNTTPAAQDGLMAAAKVYSLGNVLLSNKTQPLNVKADDVAHGFVLDANAFKDAGAVLVELTLSRADGSIVSRNFYWIAADSAAYRNLTKLPTVAMQMTASATREGAESVVSVRLRNDGPVASLTNKLTLLDDSAQRILPAYLSDNYVSLLPGESQIITIRFSQKPGQKEAQVTLRGWNAQPQSMRVKLP